MKTYVYTTTIIAYLYTQLVYSYLTDVMFLICRIEFPSKNYFISLLNLSQAGDVYFKFYS